MLARSSAAQDDRRQIIALSDERDAGQRRRSE
jgi:hypothetical protein